MSGEERAALPWLDDIIRAHAVALAHWQEEHANAETGARTYRGADGPFGLTMESTLDRLRDFRAAIAAQSTPEPSGTLTDCPIEGVHPHPFRGPHKFREWDDPATYPAAPSTEPALDVEDWPRVYVHPVANLDLATLAYVRESMVGIEAAGGTVRPVALIDSIVETRAEFRGELTEPPDFDDPDARLAESQP